MPNAPSESLEKKLFFHFLCKFCSLEISLLKKNFSFISCAKSGSEHLTPPRLFPIGTSAMAEPLARFEGFEGFEEFEGFEGFKGFEGLHFPCQTLPLNP